MGNQQMAYSSNQPPPSVEEQNEWYDSVSDIEEHKQQINSPENNVVVNGILDEFIDSLFESKLANSPSEALTGQNSPEDQQHNINQTTPIRPTYDEVALNWKGVDIAPESDCPARHLPSNFQVPPSTSDHVVFKDDYLQKESEVKSPASIRNTLQDTISDSAINEENGLMFALQNTTNENVHILKELCLKNDSNVPLPCPEDCEVFRDSAAKENVKAFELTPKDVETINQSGKFCEVFCDPKEIDSFQAPLETKDKYSKRNCDFDEGIPQDSEGIEALSTSTIIRAGEEILEKTASYLEYIASNSTSASNEIPSNNVEGAMNSAASTPYILPVDILCAQKESPVNEEHIEVKNNSSAPLGEILSSSVPSLGVDNRSASQNSNSTSEVPPKDVDTFITSLEEIVNFKSLEKDAPKPSDNKREDRKFSEVCSQKEVSISVTENISHSSPANSNDAPSSSINKETPKSTKFTPRKSSIGVLNVKRKSFSSEAEKHIEIKQNDKSKCTASKAPNACTPLSEKENRPPQLCSPSVPPVVTDMICTPIEGEEESQSCRKEQAENRQHNDSRRKPNSVCSQMEKMINMSTSKEFVKESVHKEENTTERLVTSGDSCDPVDVDKHERNLGLATRQNTTPKFSEIIEQCDKEEDKLFTPDVLEHLGVQLPEEIAFPSNNIGNCQATPLENVTSSKKALDEIPLLSPVDSECSQRKISEDIQKLTMIKESECDVISAKQENTVCNSDVSVIAQVGGLGDISNYCLNNASITNFTNNRQDDTILKGTHQNESNARDTGVIFECLDTHSLETHDFIIKGEEEKSISNDSSSVNDNANFISSAIPTDTHSSKMMEESEESIGAISNSPVTNLTDFAEAEKLTRVKHCDNANNIPSISESTNASFPLLVELPSFNSENSSTVQPKEPKDPQDKLLVDTEKFSEKQTQCFHRNKEMRAESIEISNTTTENLVASALSAPDETASNSIAKDAINNITSIPLISPMDVLCTERKSPVGEEHIEVNTCDNNNTPADKSSSSSVPSLEVDERSSSHNNSSTSEIPPKEADTVITSVEEIAKFKSLEDAATKPFQNKGEDIKFSEDCLQKEVSSSIAESISHSTPANPNDVPSSNVNKESSKNSKFTPRKSSIGVLNVKRKSFSSEAEKRIEIKQTDKINYTAFKDEASLACSSLPEKENRPPPPSSPVALPLITDVICTPIDSKGKSQSSGKEETENQSRRKSNDVSSQKLEHVSTFKESAKETEHSIEGPILPETKQYRNLYEDGNICDLDEVINQFRHKHNPENVESCSKVDKRKELLDKFNAKRPTSDVRKNSGIRVERCDFPTTSAYKEEAGVPEVKNKNVEDNQCLDKQKCKTTKGLSENDTREQNSDVLPEDLVNFRGIIGDVGHEQRNGPKKKCTDVAKEKEKVDGPSNSRTNVDKKERMPELKPETLKSLIADLSLNKSTTDIGCNTIEDWTKKDNSKAEADWLKERKKLIGRITDLHQTQNATKFIVKELIYLVTSWMEGKDKDNVDLQETRQKLINERDQALEDLRSVEESFYELHRRYEKTKKLIEDYKKNEDILKRQIADGEERLQQQKLMFDHLVKHSEDKLEKANSEILNLGKSKESEMAVLTAQLRKAEMKANSIEKALEQKVRENTELSSICEDLIAKCGKK